MMFKRPAFRPKVRHEGKVDRPVEGSFLYDIIKKNPTTFFKYEKAPIHKKDDYLKMINKNNTELGIPLVDPESIPDAPPLNIKTSIQEPYLPYSDHIQVTMRILKSGIVRIKICASIASLHEKYTKQCKIPPLKVVLQAYKAYGFSDEFLARVKKSHEKKMQYTKKVPGILEKIFDKEPVKKPKKEKKKEVVEDEPREEEEEDEPINDEDNEMDVEPDNDDEIVEDVNEEEYFSDGD